MQLLNLIIKKKDFKSIILNISKELTKAMSTEQIKKRDKQKDS